MYYYSRRCGGYRRPLYGRWGAGARPRPLPAEEDLVALVRYHAPMVLPQQQAMLQAHAPQVASPAPLDLPFMAPPSPGDSTRASVLDPAASAPPVSKKRAAKLARPGLQTADEVCATNDHILGCGSVDGDAAAGQELEQACRAPEVKTAVRCSSGEARITPDFELHVSRVSHTVGPIYDMDRNSEASLNKAYENSLKLGKENGIQRITFPGTSCGVICYPPNEAPRISVSTAKFTDDIKEVCATNDHMLGCGSVDGDAAAGQELKQACHAPEVKTAIRCSSGEARITPDFELPVSRVSHTVGPIYDMDRNSEASLNKAYENSLKLGKENGIQCITFPGISCGVICYPTNEAPRIAVSTAQEFPEDIKEVCATKDHMLGCGSVDGDATAGQELEQACRAPEVKTAVRCSSGEARVTPSFELPVSRVSHTVGPIYDMDRNSEASLNKAYENSLKLVKENGIQCIVFPGISCGVICYPPNEAPRIAVSTAQQFPEDIKEVTICFCGHKIQMPIKSGKTVLELVHSALMKSDITTHDFYMMFNGKMLGGDFMVNSHLDGANIIVVPRTRGGIPRMLHHTYTSLDSIINANTKRLFRRTFLPINYRLRTTPYRSAPVLTNFLQYLLKQVLVCVCLEGHLKGHCWKGAFKLSDFIFFNGHVIINPDIRKEKYDDDGGAADYRRLFAIFMIFVDNLSGRYPLHLEYLLRDLKDAGAADRRKPEFVAFVTNHPCLLTYVERNMLYITLDKFMFRILNFGDYQQAQNVRTRLNKLGSLGWVKKVQKVPYLKATYDYGVKNNSPTSGPVAAGAQNNQTAGAQNNQTAASSYGNEMNDCLHLSRNNVTHTTADFELAEAAVSHTLEYVLSEIIYILAADLNGPDGKRLIEILSNPKADRTTVSINP